MQPAVALLEFGSIACGIRTGDAMVKRSPVDVLLAGTVHPGKYIVLVGGLTADVEEAVMEGREVGADGIAGLVFLPAVHPDVVAALGGLRRAGEQALGVVETRTLTAAIEAADAGVKEAQVVLRELRLADDLGGKAYVLFGGVLSEVEAAVEHGVKRIAASGDEIAHVVIPQLHAEMDDNLSSEPRFLARVASASKDD